MDLYEKLSLERKGLQATGQLPEWFTTPGWQMFRKDYMYGEGAYLGQVERIANTAAQYTENPSLWARRWKNMLWDGWLSCSTPVLANTGTERGYSVSCSGNVFQDSVHDFFMTRHELAMLTKGGFGTASYFGDIRGRGAPVSIGGKADGTLPLFKSVVADTSWITQGPVRRGAWAGYLPVDHDDFHEWADYLMQHGKTGINIGWCISDAFTARYFAGDQDAVERFQKMMHVKCVTGKGYFFFTDKVNRKRPPGYVKNGLTVKASQLCSEIMLFSDADHTYICVLSSMNAAKYRQWKDTDAVLYATYFLDCINQDFIAKASGKEGMERAVRSAVKGRALGLGVCGYHTLLQQEDLPFASMGARMLNNQLFQQLGEQSHEMSRYLARKFGEPEWCEGTGMRNTHTCAIAPTMSTAQIMGGVSQGIEPYVGNAFTQQGASGEVERLNPEFIRRLKATGHYTNEIVLDVAAKHGSVQHLSDDILSKHAKEVLLTAYEIPQKELIHQASARGRWIDQGQSLNLFADKNASEEAVSKLFREGWLDPNILSMYYLRSEAGVVGSNGVAEGECVACQ